MRHYLLAMSLLCLAKPAEAIDDTVLSIKILKLPPRYYFPEISCEEFEERFTAPANIYTVSDRIAQKNILDKLTQAKEGNQSYTVGGPSSRMYIFYTSGKVDSLCFSQDTRFLYNHKTMLLPDKNLIEIIDSIKN